MTYRASVHEVAEALGVFSRGGSTISVVELQTLLTKDVGGGTSLSAAEATQVIGKLLQNASDGAGRLRIADVSDHWAWQRRPELSFVASPYDAWQRRSSARPASSAAESITEPPAPAYDQSVPFAKVERARRYATPYDAWQRKTSVQRGDRKRGPEAESKLRSDADPRPTAGKGASLDLKMAILLADVSAVKASLAAGADPNARERDEVGEAGRVAECEFPLVRLPLMPPLLVGTAWLTANAAHATALGRDSVAHCECRSRTHLPSRRPVVSFPEPRSEWPDRGRPRIETCVRSCG